MLKYTGIQIVFQEIPNEITLAINISNCPCHCEGCHSPYLAEDIGKELTADVLLKLIKAHPGISCVCFMGGDNDPEQINLLAKIIKLSCGNFYKIAWYSGRSELDSNIELENFDFIKLGPYIEKFGGLDSKETNQVLLHIDNSCGRPIVKDITSKFWK